jgi:hypothetical protein
MNGGCFLAGQVREVDHSPPSTKLKMHGIIHQLPHTSWCGVSFIKLRDKFTLLWLAESLAVALEIFGYKDSSNVMWLG